MAQQPPSAASVKRSPFVARKPVARTALGSGSFATTARGRGDSSSVSEGPLDFLARWGSEVTGTGDWPKLSKMAAACAKSPGFVARRPAKSFGFA